MTLASKVLVIQPLPGLGDLAWFNDHLKAIADQTFEKKITLLTKNTATPEVFRYCSYVDKKILLLNPWESPSFISLVNMIKEHSFSQAWVLHHSWRYVMACKLAKIPSIYAYGNNWTRFFLKPPLLTSAEFNQHPIQRATLLLSKHNILLSSNVSFQLSTDEQRRIQKDFAIYKKPWIVLGIGGSESFKKWPTNHFKTLAEYLSNQGTVFILGGKKEKDEAQSIAQNQFAFSPSHKHPIIPLTDFSLEKSLAFLGLTDYFIGNDTGMLNFSSILGKPTVGLFLRTRPLCYRHNMFALEGDAKGFISVEDVINFLEKKAFAT